MDCGYVTQLSGDFVVCVVADSARDALMRGSAFGFGIADLIPRWMLPAVRGAQEGDGDPRTAGRVDDVRLGMLRVVKWRCDGPN
jgi:hypothetical protein